MIKFDKHVDVHDFQNETKLVLREDYSRNNTYIEISGKRFETIRHKVKLYNENNNTNVFCYNDYSKDCTYVVFK